jgi:hypothetical protein
MQCLLFSTNLLYLTRTCPDCFEPGLLIINTLTHALESSCALHCLDSRDVVVVHMVNLRPSYSHIFDFGTFPTRIKEWEALLRKYRDITAKKLP